MINKEDNKIINKKESNNKKVTSISINTSTSKYISNKYYSSILYIVIKKGFTYYGELKKILNVTSNYHLSKLKDDGLLQIRKSTIEEKEYIKTLYKNVGNNYLNNLDIYELTNEALNYFTQPKVYDLLKIFCKQGIDDYIILKQNEYEQKKLLEDRQFRAKCKSLGITTDRMDKDLLSELDGEYLL